MKRCLPYGAALAGAVAWFQPADAEACGGCFIPATSPTVVTGHRMALSVSTEQTVLWDQIQYAGDPAEFAWVLPVKPGARVETATDAFFEVLEARTVTTVVQPFISCGNSGGGIGCGASDEAAGADGGDMGSPVTVVHHGTVGPYETVTLSTETPGALNTWLTEHGYNVDETVQPIIDQYVAEGFDFIALRLQPGKDVRQMTPVRVITEGATPALPLRMVAAGAGAELALVLYVIGEGRWETENFPAVAFPYDYVSWDFATSESNYAELRKVAFERAEGRGWLTTFADQGTLLETFDPTFFETGSFAERYLEQALANSEIMSACELGSLPSQGVVVQPCPPGVAWDDPSCGVLGAGEIDARAFGCEGADDISVALTGLHPADVWVTRLEATLTRDALDQDLLLRAAAEQEPVSNRVQARISINRDTVCGSATPIIRLSGSPPGRDDGRAAAMMLALGTLALGLGALVIRRRRDASGAVPS